MKKTNKKGFTLIELLVVIAIIGLLSTLAVVSLNNARIKSRDVKRQSDLQQVMTAMEMCAVENSDGSYPIGGTCAASNNTFVASGLKDAALCNGKMLKCGNLQALAVIPVDPVGSTTYTYKYTGTASSYCLYVPLEGQSGKYFKCMNGSCLVDTSGCLFVN